MLIDSNLVLVDSKELSGAPITGNEVGLTSLMKPGKFDAIPIAFGCSADVAGGTKITVKLQQADANGGSYADVPGSTFEVDLAGLKRLPPVAAPPSSICPVALKNPGSR